jgi:hypothetical protein
MECYFCGKSDGITDATTNGTSTENMYKCPRCGPIFIDRDCFIRAPYFEKGQYINEKKIWSICLRVEYEKGNRPGQYGKKLTLEYLEHLLNSYKKKDALEIMDNALLLFDKRAKHVGEDFKVDYSNDYPLYNCFNPGELSKIIEFLNESNYIKGSGVSFNVNGGVYITPKGYERLRELKKINKDSRQCFVAMWFGNDMDVVYQEAIKQAIEYIENGKTESKFKALRINDKEHTNDINDEIISEIRRSRFMVCDLTGYRGGVYWEAGFAYGLGLEVIYTCREDWIKTIVNKYKDQDGNEIEINREGIHFDLEHRNRIQWKMEELDEFKKKLTNRIKAVIN